MKTCEKEMPNEFSKKQRAYIDSQLKDDTIFTATGFAPLFFADIVQFIYSAFASLEQNVEPLP